MKLPYNTVLTDMTGNQVVKVAEKMAAPATATTPAVEAAAAQFLTLQDVLVTAFASQHPEDEKMSHAERYAFGKLGFALGRGKDLSIEEVAQVKERAGKILLPVYVVQVDDLIESAASEVSA